MSQEPRIERGRVILLDKSVLSQMALAWAEGFKEAKEAVSWQRKELAHNESGTIDVIVFAQRNNPYRDELTRRGNEHATRTED